MTEKHVCLTCERFGMQYGPTGCKVGLSTDYRTQCMSLWPRSRGTTQGELIRMHQEAESKESVDPDHYKTGGIEAIDAIRDSLGYDGFIAYCRGQILRYTWRLGKKDDALVEIGKARAYMQWIKDTLDGKPLTKGMK